jgi:anti-sigma factor RsiW
MNTTSLLALIVDQHAGELTPEVAELLEAYLAQNPTARAEAVRIREALAVTEKTLIHHPKLARVENVHTANSSLAPKGRRQFTASWLPKAASIAVLAVLTGAGGYFAGRKASPRSADGIVIAEATSRLPRKDSPWARYRFASDGAGMQIVRVDAPKVMEGTLR